MIYHQFHLFGYRDSSDSELMTKNLKKSNTVVFEILTYLQIHFHKIFSGEVILGENSMNGTPTASGQGLCAIDRVEFKVTKSCVKKNGKSTAV